MRKLSRWIRRQWHISPIDHSDLRVCFLGDGLSGSWEIRAEQMAATNRRWRAIPTCRFTPDQIDHFDVFCFVKRFDNNWARRMREAGKRVVYDIVDPWKQPQDGQLYTDLDSIRGYFQQMLEPLALDSVIFPNQAMRNDLEAVVPRAVTIYHHWRPGLQPIVVRDRARTVAYEGETRFLGPWHEIVREACRKLGLQLRCSGSALQRADIGFAARGGKHGTLLPKRYKSNVKMANMLALGLPTIADADEQSVLETAPSRIRLFRSKHDLTDRLADLRSPEQREIAHQQFLQHRHLYSLAVISRQFADHFAAVAVSSPETNARAA